MIKICNTRSESATATPSKRLVSGFLLLLASVFTTPALAQSCDPEKLYDIITSSFHQSVAQRTDGSWAGWGQQMGASAGNVLSPQDLNGVNYSALGTAAPLLVTSGSNVTSHQTIMLATDGLYAWGGAGTVINAGIKAGNNFQKFAVNAKADGLPTGVVPDDVDQLFATYRLLTIVTKTGDAWVLGNQSSNVPALLGDNSTATDNQWHRVQRPADPSQSYNATTNPLVPLQNVFALRGQRGNAAGRGAMMALTNTGGVVEAWTWGPATFLGDGSAVASRPHAVRMTLPAAPVAGAVPKMIGVTGRDTNNTNSYFVLFDSGHLYSLGNNSQRQLGDFTTTERTSWVAVERPTPGDSNVSAGPFTDVKFISVQEHDIGGGNGGAAAALITDGGVLYTWGSNEGRMIGRIQGAASVANGCPATNICNPGIPEAFLPSTHFAKLVEVGGHTTVYMRERSAKFCYVGHRIAGSMGHGGNENNSNYGPFNCEETPVLNICGSTGYDYGDAPFVYEAGGGGNLASHFYIEQEYPNPPQVGVDPENRLYLGENWPRVNDDTPHSVVISTDNTAPLGDCGDWGPGGCEEDAPTNPAQLTLPDTATSHAFDIRVFNEALDADGDPVPARLYAWVDWNNNGVFEPGEYFANGGANGLAIPQNPVPGTGQTITLNWTGLSGLTPGWRYVRLRLTTATNLADLPATPNLDERALRFAGDGEMEDFRVLIVDEDAPPNEPPVAIDVHADAVTPTAPPARLLVGGLDAALQGWDGDGTVVSYRVQTLPACHVPGSGPLPAYPAGGCRLYKRVGVTLTPLTAGEPITLAQAQDLWFETTLPTNTSFTFRAIDDDGDESVNMACDSLVNDCDNTDLLPRPGVMESRDAIFTIPVTQPVLSIEKTVSVDPGNFEIGVPASYTLTVTNTNAPTYADTDITDVIPAGLTIGALPLGCDLNPPASQTVVCTIPAPLGYGLVVNDNVASFVIPVTPAVGISNPVSNTASVTGGGSDTNCTLDPADPDCSSTVITDVDGSDMAAAFGPIPSVVSPGQVLNNLTLVCTNNGPGAAANPSCLPTVDEGAISNLSCLPNPLPTSLPVGGDITCTFTYTAPGTLGGTDTPETGVTFTGTTGADNDTDPTNNVDTEEATIIDAVDDTTSAPGGSTGNTFPLGGNDQFPPGSTFSYTGGTCANGSVNAGGTATFDATPNPCTVEYQVCAPSPNDSQCDTATLTVTSEEADMTPAFGGIPAVLEPGEVVNNATLTCTNAGPSSATDATCVPDVDLGSITNLVCVPPQPVASLPAGNSIVCTFDYAAPGIPGGEDTAPIGVVFTGTTGAVNDNNGGTTPGGNNSTTLNPPIIDALDDDFTGTSIDGATGGDTPSVVGNDTVGGDPAVIGGNVSLTPGIPSNPGLVMDPNTGIITVPALLPPGVYTYPYEICVLPATAPPTCETATATLEVSEAPSLSIVKSVTSAGPYTVGDVIAYSFLVTNTGNVTLTDVAVNDAILDAPGAVCPVTTLAPSASTTCTGSYTVQASDVPNSNVHNVATAEGVPPGPPGTPPVPSDPDDEDTVIQNPSLTIVKSVTSPGPYTGGSVISYSFLVTNTGNTVLNNVAVIDPILDAPGATCPVTTLNPTESTTCTGSYTVQPGDVETGNVHNVATAEGTPTPTPNTPTPPSVPSDPDEEDTPIEQNPSLSIVKSVTSGDQYALGDVIAYSFLVTNTGDVTLTGIVVNDPILDAPAVCDATTLVPSASTTCTGSYTVQPADVTNGNVHNEATATGTPPGSPSNPNPSDVDSPPDVEDTPVQNPSLTIVKSVTSAGPYTVGDVIAYSFLVENTGNTVLTGVAVNDSILDAPAVCGTTTLNPGDTTTCTGSYTVQASDVPNSNVHNVATAEGVPPATPTIPNPPPVPSLPDDEDTEIQNPSLTIVKSVTSPGPYTGGSTIDYSFLVENTGNTVLTGVVVIDPILDAPAVCGTTTLNPGDTTICTGSYVVQPGDVEVGNVHNVATAEGTPPPTTNTPNPLPVPSDPDEEDTPIEQNPSLSIVKSSAPGPYTGGGVIAYSFLVTNTGDVTLTEVAVNDPILDAPGAICPVTTLAPGASTTCTGSYTVQQADVEAGDVYNVATAGGTPPGSPTNPNPPDVDSPPDDENTPIEQNPSMTVIKTITSTGPYSEDSVIAYQFVVTNTGDVTLTGVTLTDPLPGLSVPACAPVQPAILAPTETMTCTANYTVTEADVQNGSVLNTATVSGQPPGSPTNPNPPPVGDDDNEVAEMAPLLSVAKALTAESIVTDGLAQPGELLTYTITVSNGAGVVAPGTVVNEVVPVGTEFVSGSPTWSCAAGAAAGTACTTQVIVPAYASGTPGQVTATFTVRVLDPLPESVQSIVNVASINGEPPADCVADPAAPTCVTTPTLNLYFDKTVVSVDTIGPNSHVVHYALTIRNVGASPATYTLSDTPGYTTSGVSFNGDVQVGTTGGTVNPALLGASFTPANGVTVQVSDLNVAIASGVTHVYTLATPIAVDADALANGACVAGTPGNGLFNAAAISGSVPQSDNACAPAPEGGGDLAIRLTKTVELAVDFNSNGWGDVGDVLNYEFLIENVGGEPLRALHLLDPQVFDLACDTQTVSGQPIQVLINSQVFRGDFELLGTLALQPGDGVQCWATHELTAADVELRRVVNTAIATGRGAANEAVSSVSTAIYSAFP